mmetsp:Transcript_19214/g.41754  ORF Transcript_19214/g.41754 Transcript_19214/m.41754 type:complete len:269 (+) Transcript_19214:167-973(+)
MNSWITLLALCSLKVGSSFSFAPATSDHRHRQQRQAPVRETHLFQSSVAIQQGRCYRNRDETDGAESRIRVRKIDAKTIVNAPKSCSTASSTHQDTTPGNGMDAEEQLTILRSKTLKELKLACSRRNIQYGKFSETEEYVQAIMKDMEKAWAFSVTGLIQPGAMTELTGEQLDQEMNGKDSLILVDVFATWCGPCRVIIPQLEVTAQKLVEDEVRVVKIDSDKHSSWVGRYQVQGLPTMLLIKEGRVVDRLEGAHMTNEIIDFVQQHA